VRAARKLAAARPFDAVISTGPPHEVHAVAARLAGQLDVAWVADLRDPPVSDFDRTSTDLRTFRRMRRLEARVLEKAGAVVTTCGTFQQDLQRRYPQRAAHVHCVPNGFDRDDLVSALPERPSWPKTLGSDLAGSGLAGQAFRFVSCGALYGRRELKRVIEPMRSLLARHPDLRQRVDLWVIGTLDGEQRRQFEADRPAWLHLAGYVDHATALQAAAAADCNLLIVPECDHGRLSVPGKTYELMALPPHILALAPRGSATADIVSRAGSASVTPLEDARAVERTMESIIGGAAGRAADDRRWDEVDPYDRRVIAQRFGQLIAGLTQRREERP
jgi:hypothetical protein